MSPRVTITLFLALIVAGCEVGDDSSDAAPVQGAPIVGSQPPVESGSTGPATGDPTTDSGTRLPAEIPLPASDMFVDGVDHSYLPLESGRFWIYEGDDLGKTRRDEVEVLEERRVIGGVACTAVLQHVYLDGELAEMTTEWYAQDHAGNVWKFGEESIEIDDQESLESLPLMFSGALVVSADSWVAGEAGFEAWLVLAADPMVGDVYIGRTPEGPEQLFVISLSRVGLVPAGTFENCAEIHENPDDEEDSDIILYSPGVGMVSEDSNSGKIKLVSTGRK